MREVSSRRRIWGEVTLYVTSEWRVKQGKQRGDTIGEEHLRRFQSRENLVLSGELKKKVMVTGTGERGVLVVHGRTHGNLWNAKLI